MAELKAAAVVRTRFGAHGVSNSLMQNLRMWARMAVWKVNAVLG